MEHTWTCSFIACVCGISSSACVHSISILLLNILYSYIFIYINNSINHIAHFDNYTKTTIPSKLKKLFFTLGIVANFTCTQKNLFS